MLPLAILSLLTLAAAATRFVPTAEEMQARFEHGQNFYASGAYDQAIENYRHIMRSRHKLLAMEAISSFRWPNRRAPARSGRVPNWQCLFQDGRGRTQKGGAGSQRRRAHPAPRPGRRLIGTGRGGVCRRRDPLRYSDSPGPRPQPGRGLRVPHWESIAAPSTKRGNW